jgi:hypothetical protein
MAKRQQQIEELRTLLESARRGFLVARTALDSPATTESARPAEPAQAAAQGVGEGGSRGPVVERGAADVDVPPPAPSRPLSGQEGGVGRQSEATTPRPPEPPEVELDGDGGVYL